MNIHHRLSRREVAKGLRDGSIDPDWVVNEWEPMGSYIDHLLSLGVCFVKAGSAWDEKRNMFKVFRYTTSFSLINLGLSWVGGRCFSDENQDDPNYSHFTSWSNPCEQDGDIPVAPIPEIQHSKNHEWQEVNKNKNLNIDFLYCGGEARHEKVFYGRLINPLKGKEKGSRYFGRCPGSVMTFLVRDAKMILGKE
jgi:hypothetical protein